MSGLKFDEMLAFKLKALYRSYGFSEYRLAGFEDYSLYAENKSFLDVGGVLTFMSEGKLLALRPDVTLSVVKNISVGGTEVKKLFYDENVYRKSNARGEFKELRQVGVEVIGDVDGVSRAEVYTLLLKTLAAVGSDYVVDVSHAGIIEKLASGMAVGGKTAVLASECLYKKSVHEFLKLDIAEGKYKDAYRAIIDLPSNADKAFEVLEEINKDIDISAELDELKAVAKTGGDKVRIDFSIGGDAEYYNGAVFKGYVDGVPYAVLSGGRYDKLLQKFGKRAKAIGFALYLGELAESFDESSDIPDIAIVYDDGCAEKAVKKAEALRADGKNVLLCRDAVKSVGKMIFAEELKDA